MYEYIQSANLKSNFFYQLPYWLLIFVAALSPFGQYQRDIFFGMSLQRIVFILLAAIYFTGLLFENRKIDFTPLIVPLFLYFIAQLIGAIQGEQPVATKSIMRTAGYIVLFLVAANLPQSRKQIFAVLFSFLISLLLIEIFSVFKMVAGESLLGLNLIQLKQQYLGDGEILRMIGTLKNPYDFTTLIQLTYEDLGIKEISRMRGTFENPNEFATLMVLSLPMCVCFAFVFRNFWARLFLFLSFLLGLVCLFSTQSKSALFAVSIGLIVAFGVLFWKGKSGKVVVLVSIVLALAAIIAFNQLPSLKKINVTARVMDVDHYAAGKNKKRLHIWKEASKFILAHPFGAGTGRTVTKIAEYSENIGKPRSPHNVFLSIGAQTGWLGILAVFLIFVFIFYHLGMGVKCANSKYQEVMILGFLSCFVAFFFHNQFHSLLKWNFVWLVFGLAFATLRISKQSSRKAGC